MSLPAVFRRAARVEFDEAFDEGDAKMPPHKKRARPSTEEKHQKGVARQECDALKKEKGDKRRGRHFQRKRRRPETEGTG